MTRNFSEYRAWLDSQEQSDGVHVSYRAGGRTAFVLSGTKGSQIIYIRVVAGCPDLSLAAHLEIEYPARLQASFDPILRHVTTSLRPGQTGCGPT